MNEFGETPSIFVWPKGHEEGQPYPEGWHERLREALATADIEWEYR